MILQSYIRKYYEAGFQVIPCNGKVPITNDWSKYADKEIPDEEISLWETKFAKSNIGLVCGPKSNIVAIDVDTLDEEILKLIPPTPIRRLGREGRAGIYFYRYMPSITNKNFDEFEILTSGRQLILPPSIHPDTKEAYKWVGDSLLDFDIEDLPLLTLQKIEALLALGESRKTKQSPGSVGRNNKLKAMITAARQKFKTDLEIAKEIYEYDKTHHMPRLFSDKSEGYGAKDEVGAFENAHRMANNVLKSFDPIQVEKDGRNSNERHQTVTKVESIRDIFNDKDRTVGQKILFPKPLGVMGTIFERCLQYSIIPREAFAMATAVSLMSTVTSGRFKFSGSNMTTNMFTMVVGAVSQGKSDPQRFIKAVLSHDLLKDRNLLGASKYASREALVAHLPEQRVRLDILDEASSFFSFSKNNERTKLMTSELNELWSNGTNYFRTSRAITREKISDCAGPQVNILFAIQPKSFISCMEPMYIDNGFIHRFLIFADSSDVDLNLENTERPVPVDDIAKTIFDIFKGNSVFERPFKLGGVEIKQTDASLRPVFEPMSLKENARKMLWDLSREYQKSQTDEIRALAYAKAGEQVRKIAMNHCLGRDKREIDIDDVVFGSKVLDCTVANAHGLIGQISANNDFEKCYNRLIAVLKKSPMKKGQLLRAMPTRSKFLAEVLTHGSDIGEVGMDKEGFIHLI